MPAPYAILEAGTVLVGLVASLFLIIVFSVDTWEEANYSFTAVNNSYRQVTVASSDSDINVYSIRGALVDPWTTYYFYHQYWGLWKLCDVLTDAARAEIGTLGGEYRDRCYNFVSEYDEESSTLQSDGRSIARLQNSGASCFIVCIIDLVAALGVGVISLINKHVTACMVTGVLYCMASLFTVFGLAIFHVKHHYELYYCQSLYPIPKSACDTRTVTILWAVPVAWVGVIICSVANTARATLTAAGLDRKKCFNFLSDYDEESMAVSTNTKSFMGLHNSTVVCFMVTIIDLIVANFLAVLGTYRKMVPVCMVAGALYCIACVFVFFGLVIFHLKHHYEHYYCHALYDIPDSVCPVRDVSVGWPVPLAWFSLILLVADSIFWVFLTQALRIIKTKTMSDKY